MSRTDSATNCSNEMGTCKDSDRKFWGKNSSKINCRFPPKRALPYFMKLVLATQLETQESETSLRLEAERRRRAEEDEDGQFANQNCTTYIDEDGEVEEECEEEDTDDGDWASSGSQFDVLGGVETPPILETDWIRQFYLKEGIKRRGAEADIWKTGMTSAIRRRFSRAVWRHSINNMEPDYRLPLLILKKHLFIKNEEPTRIGPGSYDLIYPSELCKLKIRMKAKGKDACEPRFSKETEASMTPGPMTYGNPWETWMKAVDKCKHCGSVTLLESGPCDVRAALVYKGGSGLSPAHYNVKSSSTTALLNKVVSRRGPYDLYTPPRDVIPYGYFQTRKPNPLGPGQYHLRKTFKEEWCGDCTEHKGVWSEFPRDRKFSGERILLISRLWPVDGDKSPGPGQYDPEFSFKRPNQYKHPFCDSIAVVRPLDEGNTDLAPDRYDPEGMKKYCAPGCGMRSAFKSKIQRLDPAHIHVMTERLRGKDIPKEELLELNSR